MLISALKFILCAAALLTALLACGVGIGRLSVCLLFGEEHSVTSEISSPLLRLSFYELFSNTRRVNTTELDGSSIIFEGRKHNSYRATGAYYMTQTQFQFLQDMRKPFNDGENYDQRAIVKITYKKNFLGKRVATKVEITSPGWFAQPK